MKRKAVFLDRDGTINIDKSYLYKIEDFAYQEGAKEGMKLLQEAGYLLIIITNQSGIARGYYVEEDYKRLHDWLISDLSSDGIHITEAYHCPHHPDALVKQYRKRCKCRKPEIGLFLRAAKELDIDFEQSYAIGDKMRDLQICKERGVRGFLLYSDKVNIERTEKSYIKKIKGGILEAAVQILQTETDDYNATMDKRGY